MAIREQQASFEAKISQQLHLFSELSEMLTLRVLDLEERFKAFEISSHSQLNSQIEKTSELLRDSEEKMRNLQSLLKDDGGGTKSLQLLDRGQQERLRSTSIILQK